MSKAPKPIGEEQIVFQGKIIEVVQQEHEVGEKTKVFELARRSPGARIILHDRDKDEFVVSKEFRTELSEYDVRLPGGKVFDTLDEYNSALSKNEDIEEAARAAVTREAKEEVGVEVNNLDLVKVSKCGATVDWTLYYFLSTDFKTLEGQELEAGEDIEVVRVSRDELKELLRDGGMKEDRSVGVLYAYLANN